MRVDFLERVWNPARLLEGSDGFGITDRYVSPSLYVIPNIQQCTSWPQQPGHGLREMIASEFSRRFPFKAPITAVRYRRAPQANRYAKLNVRRHGIATQRQDSGANKELQHRIIIIS
jgi:hypothetical protein